MALTDSARSDLIAALNLAAPENAQRVFLDEGPDLIALLTGLRGDESLSPEAQAHLETLLLTAVPSLPVFPSSRLPVSSTDALTARELEILELIDAGLTNREIADRLFVTVGTVKTHTHRAYAKLGVHGRTQALARARTLGLI